MENASWMVIFDSRSIWSGDRPETPNDPESVHISPKSKPSFVGFVLPSGAPSWTLAPRFPHPHAGVRELSNREVCKGGVHTTQIACLSYQPESIRSATSMDIFIILCHFVHINKSPVKNATHSSESSSSDGRPCRIFFASSTLPRSTRMA